MIFVDCIIDYLLTSFCYETSDACYHVSSESVTPPEAEVSCGILGGRLASFVNSQELADLRNNLMYYVYPTEFWIGIVTNVPIIVNRINLAFLGSCVDLNTTRPIQ